MPLPAIHACPCPAFTRRQSPPSPSPRLLALASDECELWLGARDAGARQEYPEGHGYGNRSRSGGMTIGIAPVTGIPLPLISYGGSSLLTTLILIGLLEAVHVRGRLAGTR